MSSPPHKTRMEAEAILAGSPPRVRRMRRSAQSGVHERAPRRILVLDGSSQRRSRWQDSFGTRVQIMKGRGALAAVAEDGLPVECLVVGLDSRLAPEARLRLLESTALVRDAVPPGRIIIDVHRCDVATTTAILGIGVCICVDDHQHTDTAQSVARSAHLTPQLVTASGAYVRLAKTLAATIISDEHGLSPSEHRVLRAHLDQDGFDGVAEALHIAASTCRNHGAAIRRKAGAASMGAVLREARDRATEALMIIGALARSPR